MNNDEIRDHYRRIESVIKELASVEDAVTIGLNDHRGWYVKQDNDDVDTYDRGYPEKGRPATFDRDYDRLVDRIERTLYATTSYKDRSSIGFTPCTFDKENGRTKWLDDEGPMPGYADILGFSVWGDIDLCDDLKPERGNLSGAQQNIVEQTLYAYWQEFASLYGDETAIFGLDSVGGAYIMGPPAATVPIADHFEDADESACARVMEEFNDRANAWLVEAQARVEERVSDAERVIDPDWVNNVNRQYKAPLSLHADHNAVVTPLVNNSADQRVNYSLTPVGEVDDDLVEHTEQWAAGLTDPDRRDLVGNLVANLWPDEYAEADGDWAAALDAWVEAEREAEREEERRIEEARQRREERREEMDGIEGLPITPFVSDVYDAIEDLDAESVAEDTIVYQWTEDASGKRDTSGSGKKGFIPIWGRTANGTATYINTEKGTFVDTGDGNKHGTVVEMALLAHANWAKGDIASGSDWAEGVDILRGLGYEIPVWIPEAGSKRKDGGEYDAMPYWAVRKAAVTLKILPKEAFIPAHDDSGGYLAFPGAKTYNRALAAIEDAGLEHGREFMTEDGERPSDEELTKSGVDDDAGSTAAESQAKSSAEGDADAVERDDGDASEAPSVDSDANTSDSADRHETTTTTPPTSTTQGPPGGSATRGTELEYENGGYGYWETTQNGESYYDEVTNFQLEARSFLRAERGNEILVQLTVWPAGPEPEYELTCPMDVFNDIRRFRDTVVLGRTTTFDGGQSDLNELRRVVGLQDAPERDGTHHMGLHRDEFVTPNGVLRSDGWTNDPQHVYQERNIDTERAWALSPEEHTEYDPSEVVDILELVHNTRHVERLLPVLGWFYSAPLRPFIQEEEGQFNHLHIRGGTGAGKSSTVETLTRMFGMDGSGKKVDSTTFTLMAAMASSNAVPIWFDEYKPGDIESWKLDKFQNLLRLNTKWEYDTRGNADKSTEEYHLRAPIVITGEQAIQGSAEERRSIQVAFRDDVKGAGNPMNRAFAELAGLDWDEADDPDAETHHFDGHNLPQHALAFYRFALSLPFGDLRETWWDSREHVRRVVANAGLNELDDLPRQGLQTIHFGMTVFRGFARAMLMEGEEDRELADLDLPTEEDVNAAIIYAAEEMGGRGDGPSHLNEFVNLAQRAARANYLEEGVHYKFVHEGEASEELRINLNQSFDEVSKYVKDHDLSSEDFLNRAKDYRDRMKMKVEQGDGYMVEYSRYTAGINNSCGIHVATAEEQLENFSKAVWTGEPETHADAEDHSDAKPVTKTGPGYHDLTLRVERLSSDTPDSIALSGAVRDSSGVVDLVQWDRSDADTFDIEEGKCYRFDDANLGTNSDNAQQVELVDGVTKIREIKPGAGTLDFADAGDNETLDAAADGGQASIDPVTDDDDRRSDGDDDPSAASSTDTDAQTDAADSDSAETDADGEADADSAGDENPPLSGDSDSVDASASDQDDSPPRSDIEDWIRQAVTMKQGEGKSGAPVGAVVEKVAEKSVAPERIQTIIERMIERGNSGIYEPVGGELRAM